MRALVVVHVAPHVISQVPLYGELLLAGCAREGMSVLLFETMILELDPVGKQTSAVGAADQLLLAVTSEVFPQLGDHGVSPGAAQPPARLGVIRLMFT